MKSPEPAAFTRRQTLCGIGAATAAVGLPGMARANVLQDLHLTVAERVRDLAQGRDITLSLLLPHGSNGNVAPVIAAFQQMTGVRVTYQEASVEDINTDLSLDTLSNSQKYDLALPATFALPDLVTAGAILPVTEYAQRYEPAGFRQGVLYGAGDHFDGELYGYQADGDAYIMFYHKDMLENPAEIARYEDRFGHPLQRPRTWVELDRHMAFFNRPEEGQWGGLLFRSPDYLAWEWWVRLHAKGLWPFSPDMQPQIASDAGVQALEEMIRASEYLHPSTSSMSLFDNWKRYEKGDIYCNIGWGGTQKYMNRQGSKMRGRLLYGPTPGGIVDDQLLITPYFNWGWNYVVSRTSSEPEIAYLFALFSSSPEISTLSVRQIDGFFDPFRPEHYDDPGINAAYTPDFLTVHRASLEMAIPDLYLGSQGEYFRILKKWLVRAIRREASPEKALERVSQRWELITSGAGRSLQIERWSRLRANYPEKIGSQLSDISEAG